MAEEGEEPMWCVKWWISQTGGGEGCQPQKGWGLQPVILANFLPKTARQRRDLAGGVRPRAPGSAYVVCVRVCTRVTHLRPQDVTVVV